jgi:acyl carrier protein
MREQQKTKLIVSKETKMEEKLFTLVARQLGIDEADISLSSNFMDDLGADSLDTVELVMLLEDEFDIEIPDDVATELHTVADVYNYLEANIK